MTIQYQMFIKNLTFFCLFSLLAIFYSCTPGQNPYENLLDGVSAKPQVLQMHRDSVKVDIQGLLPIKYLSKDTKILFYPEYRYGEGSLRLGEFVPFDGEYSVAHTETRINRTVVFPYLPGMEKGELVLKTQIINKGKSFKAPEKVLANGLNTAPLLTRLGQVTPDEPIPEIGIYMSADFSGINTQEERNFTLPFVLGTSNPTSNALPASLRDLLVRGEQGMAIKEVKIVGLHSAENQELADPNLARKRSERAKAVLGQQNQLKFVPIRAEFRKHDWFDFRLLLGEYKGLNDSQKEAYYSIILDRTDFESQLRKMRQLNTFQRVSRDIFPKLRGVKVTVILENTRFSDPEIAASVFRLLRNGESLEDFTPEHLIYAGQKAIRLHEKEAIYKVLTEIAPSELSFNNLGVVYLNQAQRELDFREKTNKINQAVNMFRDSNRIRNTSVAMHNLGRTLILRNDYFDAYVAISEASGLEWNENNEFLRYNEGIRGALDILNGDYKLATIRLNRAPESEVNWFNKGLAYFLAEDYQQALIAFEESVQANREYGYGFYGLAMVAAVNRDRPAFYENLKKAVNSSANLKERALKDIMFYPYQSEEAFLDVFK